MWEEKNGDLQAKAQNYLIQWSFFQICKVNFFNSKSCEDLGLFTHIIKAKTKPYSFFWTYF